MRMVDARRDGYSCAQNPGDMSREGRGTVTNEGVATKAGREGEIALICFRGGERGGSMFNREKESKHCYWSFFSDT